MLSKVCGPGWKNQLYSYKHYLMNGLCYSMDWTKHGREPRPHAPLADRGGVAFNNASALKALVQAVKASLFVPGPQRSRV